MKPEQQLVKAWLLFSLIKDQSLYSKEKVFECNINTDTWTTIFMYNDYYGDCLN